jgi:hypothetical protein
MSANRITFDVSVRHISPEGSKAGIDFTETSRPGMSVRELRQLLRGLIKLAPTVEYPAEPTVRIEAPAGRFLVQVKAHHVQFISWSSSQSHPVTPPVDEMLRIFAGEAIEGELEAEDPVAPTPGQPRRNTSKVGIAVLIAVIVGLNAFTFLNARKPPSNFLAPHKVVTGPAASQALEGAAGRYETGSRNGDRAIVLSKDGNVEWLKYGNDRAVAQRQTFPVQMAESKGTPALLTSRQTLITIKDPITLVYFGDAYTRVTK